MMFLAKAPGPNAERATMTTRTQTPHLGEREFLDYPVFLEAGSAERREVLVRALIATACVLLVAGAVAVAWS